MTYSDGVSALQLHSIAPMLTDEAARELYAKAYNIPVEMFRAELTGAKENDRENAEYVSSATR